MPFCVGLTGGAGSGKSLVGHLFENLGVPVLDADQVAREVVIPGSAALAEIARQFGAGFLNAQGELDRARMRAHVFGKDSERRKLEAILHPLIEQRLRQWRDDQTTPYCILSAAILLETRFIQLVDRVLVVDVPETLQIQRLIARDGIEPALAEQMLRAQMPRQARLSLAQDVIVNDGNPEQAAERVRSLHAAYLLRSRNIEI